MDGWLDKRRSVHSTWASQVAPVVKNPPANTGDVGDAGSIPGGGHGNALQYSCQENPEPGGLQSRGSQRVLHDRARARAALSRK